MTQTLLVTGAGGVGKTTIAAALGVKAARSGLRTLVITVDPARRLATALGVDNLGNEPQPHPTEERLWAAMLDAPASWRAVAIRHAEPEVATRLADNEFFRAASEHFPASQSYAAADQAVTYVQAKVWDLVVVDTPPSAGGIDFFRAPAEMADLVGGRLLRWITGGPLPGRFLFNLAGRPVLRIADSILGSDLLVRVAEFLLDLRTTYDGVSRRGREIESVLGEASLLVVTTSDAAPVREAIRFYRDLPGLGKAPKAVIFNRILPVEWSGAVAPPGTPPHLAANLARWSAEAVRQRDTRRAFSSRYGARIGTIPLSPRPPTDIDGLADLLGPNADLPWADLEIAGMQ